MLFHNINVDIVSASLLVGSTTSCPPPTEGHNGVQW